MTRKPNIGIAKIVRDVVSINGTIPWGARLWQILETERQLMRYQLEEEKKLFHDE